MALAGFSGVVAELERAGTHDGDDTLLTGALLRKGILLDAGGDYARARTAYCRVLARRAGEDSLVFVTRVYAGTAYYNLDQFDSANYFLLRAETMAGRFHDRENSVRLFNTLGALYCDNGNFRQGRSYFDRSLELVRGGKSYDTSAAVSLQINIATASFRVGQYDVALAMYRRLLGYRPLRDYVYENMGRAYAAMENDAAALQWYRRVSLREIPRVLNEMAYAELRLNRPDSCRWFLRQLRELGRREGTGRITPLDLGVNALYGAQELRKRGDIAGALHEVQQAVVSFAGNFSQRDGYGNPVGFTGAFAYYRLFDALVQKAQLYRGAGAGAANNGLRIKSLEASYATYAAALSLLRYIERSYATDEAKLFLKKKSGAIHAEALSVCLELDRLHPGGDYLEQAFLIGERSKASVITANLEERAFMGAPEAKGLLEQVDNYKYRIARLNVRSEGMTDSAGLAAIAREKEADETGLLRLQKALEQDGEYYRVKYGDASPGIRQLQAELGRNQALISLYSAGGTLHLFVVTSDGLRHIAVDSLTRLEADVEAWLSRLKANGSGSRWNGGMVGRRLYSTLVRPIQEAVGGRTEWVIVPDGVMSLLPFESLYADAAGDHWLVESTTISYRFSSRLLSGRDPAGAGPGSENGSARDLQMGVLAFAPFGDRGAEAFQRLPASKEEIAGLPGMQWLDGQATKERFLASVNRYPIVHLATHAVSSMDDAAGSFIAFYPNQDRPIEDRLYLEELYGLNLQKTRLVIISACETGQGEVVPQEGVISLARAFAYAGCGSTINSLWKADDLATSAILRRFYVHLREGETQARSLQLAKLDYLHSDAIDKSPAYWAHLVLTGDSDALYPRRGWLLWLVIGLGVFAVAAVLLVRRPR
jgi:CHAT domain-containing protein